MHDHNGKNDNWMMWVMIPCLLLFGLLFFGGSKLISLRYFWLIMVGICVVPHVWMMFRGHGGHGNSDDKKSATDSDKQPEEKNEHKHGGCCH